MHPSLTRWSQSPEARWLAALLIAWLSPWAVLRGATWAAGGEPACSPLAFVEPRLIVARLHRDAGVVAPWEFVDPRRSVAPATFWLACFAMCALALAVVIAAMRTGTAIRESGRGSRRGLPRTSRWATWWDLRHMRRLRRRDGTFLLGYRGALRVVTEPETSVLVVGPTRSGKTSAIVVPNLLAWHGPAVVTSTKTELVDVTAAHRQSIGPAYVYDPTGEARARYRTVTWSPIAGCRSLDVAWTVASWLCAPLQSGNARGDNDWMHWAESGKLLIAPLLYAAEKSALTIVDVLAWIHGFDLAAPSRLLEDLAVSGVADARDADRALSMLSAVDQRPERERGTVFSTVMRIFSAFNEQAVAESALSSRFDANDMIARRGTLYLCTPRQAPERVASLFVGILMTVVTAAYSLAEREPRGRLAIELGLFLDELANIVPVEDLPALASQGAGRGVLLMSIVQDLSQLRARYGTDRANSILNNHGCKVILPGISDTETAEVLSRMVGKQLVADVQTTRTASGAVSRSYSLRPEAMAAADSLRRLARGRALVVHRDSAPVIVRLRPWFRSRSLRERARRRVFAKADYAGKKL